MESTTSKTNTGGSYAIGPVKHVLSDTSFAYKGKKLADQKKNTAYLKIRERYIRNDVTCGFTSCPLCASNQTQEVRPQSIVFCFLSLDVLLFYLPLLQRVTPDGQTSLFRNRHDDHGAEACIRLPC